MLMPCLRYDTRRAARARYAIITRLRDDMLRLLLLMLMPLLRYSPLCYLRADAY